MLTRLRSHISSNLIGYLALFVALGGTSYAVSTGFIDSREIKNNTIRTGDLRNNEVRSRDIRNRTLVGRDHLSNSLGGDQIAESKLGEVPTAGTADNALALGGLPASSFPKATATAVNFEHGATEGDVLVLPGFGVLRLGTAGGYDGCDSGNEAIGLEFRNDSGGDLDFFVFDTTTGDTPETVHATLEPNDVSTGFVLGDSQREYALVRLGSVANPGRQATVELFFTTVSGVPLDRCRVSVQAGVIG
jgi:hypothetical protein